MKVRSLFAFCLVGSLLHPGTGIALEARDIFKLAEPNIVVVLASGAKDGKNIQGSGVVLAPLEILTSCKLVESAADIVVSQANTLRIARLRYKDTARDLCQLHIDDALPTAKLVVPAPSSKDLEIGQDVYTISSPRGLDRTLGRSMISGLREMSGSPGRLIQFDAVQAAGSTGGGVFDQQGRLVGIITQQFRQNESESHAIPVEWIADLGKLNQDLMTVAPAVAASTAASAAPPADGRWHPAKGDRWHYRLLDGRRSAGTVNIEVVESGGGRVRERITKDGSPGFSIEREVRPEFAPNAFLPMTVLPGGYKLIELSAYFPPDSDLTQGKLPRQIPGDLELLAHGKRNLVWDARVAGRERIRVPAGEFDAWKIEATSQTETRHGPMKFTYRIWYSQGMQRAVKIFLDINSPLNIEKSSESLELAAFEKSH